MIFHQTPRRIRPYSVTIIVSVCSLFAVQILSAVSSEKAFTAFQKQVNLQGNYLRSLEFPTTAEAVASMTDAVLAKAETSADAIAELEGGEVNFDNTLGALDLLRFELWSEFGQVYLMKEVSPIAEVREAGTEAVNRVQEWEIALGFREDIYESVKAYAESPEAESLTGEAKKLLVETMRSYHRLGYDLPLEERKSLEALQKETSRLETEFRDNIRNTEATMRLSGEELKGLPEDFLEQPEIQTGDDEWTLDAATTFHYIMVAENAEDPEVRKRFYLARYNRARELNLPLLKEIVTKRQQAAEILGYASWADYKTEVKMAESEKRVREFLDNLSVGLESNFQAERERLAKMKQADLGLEEVALEDWDRSYYKNQLKKEVYAIDTEALRRYFPYDAVLGGMFELYEQLFGIEITPVSGVDVWDPSVETYVISDSANAEVMGLFYLDMYPRTGKYNHFASFGVIDGKRLPDGRYNRPVNVLVCNFPPPSETRPSLLSYSETETLFHEFGHLLHAILTRAEFVAFSGTNVPRDFVEAPSQMLEFWLEDKQVLDRFAADYEDTTQKLPEAVLEQLIAAEKSTISSHYRAQIALGMMDLNLHTSFEDPSRIDVLEITQDAWAHYFAPNSVDTAFAASFGHLMGYDAGYYGYIWSEAIAADMASVFRDAPGGFLDETVGRRLREEIYAVGDSRDINESIEKFLGRPVSQKPFFESVGLNLDEEE